MKCKVERMNTITRAYVRANPNKLFLFGDNLERKGFGGQAAAMRGEPNAIGVPTKKKPSHFPDAYFTDSEFEQNKFAIDIAFVTLTKAISDSITAIVIPTGWSWNRTGTVKAEGASDICLPTKPSGSASLKPSRRDPPFPSRLLRQAERDFQA
jgi:hypothetical protein